ncbi:MAG TPA: hypothetical protein DIW31_04820 [Bacteroidales bacterium]|nr:hypothetical protein [Bacteroidales bacterium]
MDNKEKYFQALKANKGHLDEIDLGESVNIGEESTRKIISMLLSENKIEYVVNGACNYRIKSKKTK